MNTNRTARTALRLLVATPIAVSAIAFGSGVAHADGFEPNGPIVIANPDGPKGPGDIANPEPEPQPDPPAPEPQGPGDIANPDDDGPKGPGDIANPEDDDPKPEGPGDITNPEDDDDPKPEGPDDLANPEPGNEPEDKPADKGDKGDKDGKGDKDVDVVNTGGLVPDYSDAADVPVPSRIDAGAASATEEEQGMELMWVLAGGGVVTAAGAAFARQRLARR